MTRILLVSGIFPPHIGGPATFIDQLGHKLSHLGHTVTVVCLSDVRADEKDRVRPFRVHRVFRGNPWFSELQVRSVLLREMARHESILVNGLDFQAYQTAKLTRRRFTLKIVGDVLWEGARTTGETTLGIDEFQSARTQSPDVMKAHSRRQRILGLARQIVTPSEYLKNMVEGWGVEPHRITVIPNGVSQQEFAHFEPKRRISGDLEVIFVGRLTNWKGVETLLLAACGLEKVHITIVGDGGELPLLTGLARQLQLGEKVEFVGRLPRSRVQERLMGSHVLVLPSLYEGLSHTLLEASAAGIPSIASNCGGNPETITSGVNGILVPPQDVEALRDALRHLQSDEDFRLRLAVGAKHNSKKFPFEETVQRTVGLLIGDVAQR